MIVSFLEEALIEVAEAVDWFDNQSSGLGAEFRREFEQNLESIGSVPDSFARLEFLRSQRWSRVRRAVMRRFSYVIVFDVRDTEALIVAVYHARRRPNYWFKRLLSKS